MLREMNPNAYVEIAPEDAKKIGIANGAKLKLTSRRGELVLPAWITERARPGMVFVPWFDASMLINILTIDDLKSLSGAFEPDYKVCAVKIAKV
jgi:nitrate reductase NapA